MIMIRIIFLRHPNLIKNHKNNKNNKSTKPTKPTSLIKKGYRNKTNNELEESFDNRISNFQFKNVDSNNRNNIEIND